MEPSSTTDGPGARPRRKDAERNRAALIAAGAELFTSAASLPTLDDIAHHAGVGVGTAYRHFPNKYALAQAVLAQTVEAMLEGAERAAASDDAVAGLNAFFASVLEPQSHKRALGALLRRAPGTEPDTSDVQGRIERAIDALLQRGREQKSIRPDLASTDIGVLLSALTYVIDTYGDTDPHLWRRLVPILLDGLRASAPTPLDGRALDVPDFLQQLRGP